MVGVRDGQCAFRSSRCDDFLRGEADEEIPGCPGRVVRWRFAAAAVLPLSETLSHKHVGHGDHT